jgi:hypothetical protein
VSAADRIRKLLAQGEVARDGISSSATDYWNGRVDALEDALAVAEPPAWQPKPITYEWARGWPGPSLPVGAEQGGYRLALRLLADGYTVAPYVPGYGCPATRPIGDADHD